MYERVVKLFEEQGFTEIKVDQNNGHCTISGYAPGHVTKWPLDRAISFKDRLKRELPSAKEIGADYKPVDGDYKVKFFVTLPSEAGEQEVILSA